MFDLDAAPKRLFTTESNPKLAKGAGWLIAGLHLAPHKLAGVGNLCPYASEGCRIACINFAGYGGIGLDADGLNVVQAARIRRTRYFKRDQAGFMLDLVMELEALERRAIRKGLKLAVRLNVLSDVLWERIPVGAHSNIMAMFPGVTFYDYTKVPMRYRAERVGAIPNYSLTFSLNESNDRHALEALTYGVNVAVAMNVRKGQPLPQMFYLGSPELKHMTDRRVIDGDATDLRFLDDTGVIVGLRAKGSRGKADTSGFVRNV